MTHRAINALIGAYVADAATLGVHWLYEPERIEMLGDALWREPSPDDFEGAKGVFVHQGKQSGDISQYGAQMRVMIRTLIQGAFDATTYHQEFAHAFGPGGWWHGYIDKATKGALANIAAERFPAGANDDQIPALSGLPALLAAGASQDNCAVAVQEISNTQTTALYAPAASAALGAILGGETKADALAAGISAAPSLPLIKAIESPLDPVVYAGEVGRACPLPQTVPVAFRIAAACHTYQDAIETNARVGGDNCGRAIFLGAFFGAMEAPPALWILNLNNGQKLAQEIAQLFPAQPAR